MLVYPLNLQWTQPNINNYFAINFKVPVTIIGFQLLNVGNQAATFADGSRVQKRINILTFTSLAVVNSCAIESNVGFGVKPKYNYYRLMMHDVTELQIGTGNSYSGTFTINLLYGVV